MPTTQITSSVAHYLWPNSGIGTLRDWVDADPEQTEAEVDAMEAALRDYIQAALPKGWSLSGEFIFAECDQHGSPLAGFTDQEWDDFVEGVPSFSAWTAEDGTVHLEEDGGK